VTRPIPGILALAAILPVPAAASAGPPTRTTVLSGRAARDVLRQCSRPAPAAGTSFFRPGRAEIDSLDRAVSSSRSASLAVGARSLSGLRSGYAVEVVGIVRSGRRFVYGNYYPLQMQDGVKSAPSSPTVVCDGGSRFFGAEIDAGSGRLVHIAFNGR
jgi:hypothetical protein